MFFYLKCVTSREKFPGGETNLSRLLERAVLLPQGQEEKSPEDLAVASLLQLVAVALGRNTSRVGLPELIEIILYRTTLLQLTPYRRLGLTSRIIY